MLRNIVDEDAHLVPGSRGSLGGMIPMIPYMHYAIANLHGMCCALQRLERCESEYDRLMWRMVWASILGLCGLLVVTLLLDVIPTAHMASLHHCPA